MSNLVFLDILVFISNIVLLYLFCKHKSIFQINLIIIINASRLLITYFITDNIYYQNHFFPVFLLIFINLFNTEKLITSFFMLQNYLKILILFFLVVFTFKENFLILHPGIGGWTYEGEYEVYLNQENFLIQSQDDNLKLKNEIQSYLEDRKIVGFTDGYLDINEIEVANTNLGNFIINDGDFHIVFPDVLFNNFDPVSLEKIKINILKNTLCDRLNNKRYFINRSISYPDHSIYFKLKSQDIKCNSFLVINDISTYKIYANIESELYKVKKIEKINK